MEGLHLIADLHDCRCASALLCDAAALRRHCLAAVTAAGLQAVGELFHPFAPVQPDQPAGVTGVVLLAESHLALHTWPELALVTLDIYVCNRSIDMSAAAQRLLQTLQTLFEPGRPQLRQVRRSDLAAVPAAAPHG
jgi:S-adenosylmethionine decarboxylase